jgi:twitching motility two-component system response regulator PilH
MVWENRMVMLVDGSATLRYYYGILLKRLDFTVTAAGSAEEALAFLKDMLPSLILTELPLPGMSGIDFIRTIKGSDKTRRVPVIVFSDREDAEARAACLGMGCADFLIKNAEPGNIYRTMETALQPRPREHIRLSVPLKVVVGDGTAQGGAARTEYATSISEGGLYLRTLYPRPKNSFTPISIFIKDRAIRATASVLYNRPMEGGVFKEPGMGLKFVDLSPLDRSFLRRFIKEQLTSDITIGP